MSLEVEPERSFGQALIVATRHGARSLDVFVDVEWSGAVARRAEMFDPKPVVWSVLGSNVEPAKPAIMSSGTIQSA